MNTCVSPPSEEGLSFTSEMVTKTVVVPVSGGEPLSIAAIVRVYCDRISRSKLCRVLSIPEGELS